MNKINYGVPSLILGGISAFYSLLLVLDGRGPGIFIGLMSIGAIIFGSLASIKRQFGISAGTGFIGLILGILCLLMALPIWLLDRHFNFNPGYKDVCFLGNTNTVGFRYCNLYKECFIKYTYDVSTQKFSNHKINNNLGKYSYSRDGSKMVFVDGSEEEKNIFVMNADGNEKRQLTRSIDLGPIKVVDNFDYKRMHVKTHSCPSFDPDGKRVIFVRCTFLVKNKAESNLRNCDIYETDLNTGVERRLTNYNFDNVSCPHYLSDGKHFIFSGVMDMLKPEIASAYAAQYKGNIIFIMDDSAYELKPAIIHTSFSQRPSISFDDKITYIASIDGDDRYYTKEVFIKVDNEIKQLTDTKSEIISVEISSDGKFIVFQEERIRDNFTPYHFWLMNSDGKDLKELIPPKD
jgi:hypothetical protein